MWPFSKKKKEKKSFLQKRTVRKLNSVLKKEPTEKSFIELSEIFTKFIKTKYKIKKELTYEELCAEIKKHKLKSKTKKELIILLRELNQTEYNEEKITKKKMKILAKKAEDIVHGI